MLEIPETPTGIDMNDVEITTTKGDGPGGQHRNKTESAVIAIHRPTGIKVRIESDRSQHKNKATALSVLAAKVVDARSGVVLSKVNEARRRQVGSGERGDKVRTYRQRDNQVNDHRTGQRWQLTQWLAGNW